MILLAAVLGLVAAARLLELWLARRHTRALLAAGAVEIGAGHYPLFVLLHGSWLLAIAITAPHDRPPVWELLAAFVLLQAARAWVVLSLGRFWTTRIITLPGAPLVRSGPYRWLRHPNYWVVSLEIAVLPLAWHSPVVALIWSALNALLLRHRIRLEQTALASRMITL
jgi:methyltransferase